MILQRSAKIINMSEKGKSKRATIVLVLAILAIIILSGCAMCFFERTVVTAINVVLPAISVGFIVSYLCKGLAFRVSGNRNFLINYIVQGVLFSALFSSAFLIGNYTLGGKGLHQEEVTVERVYSKTQHRPRRVGRRYVGQGQPYKVYYMEIAFANGNRKEIRLGQTGYHGHKKGQKLRLDISTGLFGLPIITSGL